MMEPDDARLEGVPETLLLPLWGRAVETLKDRPLLVDHLAVSIIGDMSCDFVTRFRNVSSVSQMSWIARSLYFDREIGTFLGRYPQATIVDIGCGLDTTFERVDNGEVQWFDLDVPEVIALRKKYIAETERRRFIAKSVFDMSWCDEIDTNGHLLIVMAGVLYYFEPDEIRKLLADLADRLSTFEMIFDYCSKTGVRIANRRVLQESGMQHSASLKWGTDNLMEMQRWDPRVRVLGSEPMFGEHRKRIPLRHRIGPAISDAMRIMSLAHIQIGQRSGA